MYLKINNPKSLLVIKHSEVFLLNSLPFNVLALLKKRVLVGLYIGFFRRTVDSSKCDFIIFPDGSLGEFDGSIPRFPFSGFNFLPDSFHTCNHPIDNRILYIGDLSIRKNLSCFLRFAFRYSEVFEFRCLLRISSVFDRFIIFLLNAKYVDIDFIVPKSQASLPRDFVFSEISASGCVFIPYSREGAARVFGEAELLGKSILYNDEMVGGTLAFFDPRENLPIKYFNAKDLASLPKKNLLEKSEIYCCRNTTKKFEEFLNKNFNVGFEFDGNELVNAFSGHKNLFPARFSNNSTDEIFSHRAFSLLLHYHFGIKYRLSFSGYIYSLHLGFRSLIGRIKHNSVQCAHWAKFLCTRKLD